MASQISKGRHPARARPGSKEFQTAEQKMGPSKECPSKSDESTASRLFIFRMQDDFFIAGGQQVAQVRRHSP